MESNGFLEQALVYLAAGVIAVPVFKRLGLGSVLGYLVAGVAIGPWGMRLVSDPHTVLQIAEFGVVLLLFLVGLELNAQRVWAMRRAIFGLGGVQVVATIAATAAIVATTCTAPRPKIERLSAHTRAAFSSSPTRKSSSTTPNSANCSTVCGSAMRRRPHGPMATPATR